MSNNKTLRLFETEQKAFVLLVKRNDVIKGISREKWTRSMYLA